MYLLLSVKTTAPNVLVVITRTSTFGEQWWESKVSKFAYASTPRLAPRKDAYWMILLAMRPSIWTRLDGPVRSIGNHPLMAASKFSATGQLQTRDRLDSHDLDRGHPNVRKVEILCYPRPQIPSYHFQVTILVEEQSMSYGSLNLAVRLSGAVDIYTVYVALFFRMVSSSSSA